ncbi:hypothetical protein [Saccharothrix sp. ST-888]|uniref:hypothetical protein n=1 Tax=Saccharothrix sp. ST-888 TaxID=1427391 RepID=UPI000696B273|nr:hypothetical protein [Saccharothrix sp. ST-888]
MVLGPAAHQGRTYELVGERAIGGEDLARVLGESTGRPIRYEPGSLAEARAALAASGAAAFQEPMVVSTLSATASGFLDGTTSDLAALLGRAPRSALDVIADAVRAR